VSINSRTLQLAKSTPASPTELGLIWSNRFFDFVKYTLFRSRGFAIRKSSGLITEAIEIICLALIASQESFKLGLAISIASLVLNSLTQGILFSMRVDLFSFRKVSTKALYCLLPSIAAVIYFVALSAVGFSLFLSKPLLLFLVACRLGSYFIQLVFEIASAEYGFQKRVYLSPWISVGMVAVVAATGTGATLFPSMKSIFLLVGICSFSRLALSTAFFIQTQKAMRARPIREVMEETGTPSLFQTLSRSLLLGSAVVASLLPAFFLEEGFLEIFAGILIAKNLISMLAQRPFRVIQIEIVKGAQFKQWEFISLLLSKATHLSLVVLGYATILALGASLFVENNFVSLGILWALVFTLNSVLILRLMSVGLDTEATLVVVGPRALGVLIMSYLFFFSNAASSPLFIATALASESLVMAFLGIQAMRRNLVRRIEFVVENASDKTNLISAPSVLNFLNCFRVITPFLETIQVPHDLMLLKMRRPLRHPRKASQFVKKLSVLLRKSDLVVALNSTHLIIWAPGSIDHRPIKARLLKAFPLEIDSFCEIEKETFLKLLRGGSLVGNQIDTQLIKAHSFSFLAGLELILRNQTRLSNEGTWWVLSAEGNWTSLQGPADRIQSQVFHKIAVRAMQDIFLAAGRNKVYKQNQMTHWVLSPYGKVLALFVAPKISEATFEGLRTIHHQMVSEIVEKSAQENKGVSPAEFFMLKRILEKLKERVSFSLEMTLFKESLQETHKLSIAKTESGLGLSLSLVVDKMNLEIRAAS